MTFTRQVETPRALGEWEGNLDRDRTDQIAEATKAVDPSRFIHWPWRRLHTAYGPIMPGQVSVVAAMTGQGKTTFLTSLAAELANAGHRVWYAGLESPAAELFRLWAAWSLHFDAVAVREYDLVPGDLARVNAWIADAANYEQSRMGFSTIADLSPTNIRKLYLEAAEHEATVVMIDHLNHSTSDYGDLKKTLHEIHWNAKNYAECGQTTIAAAQIKRDQLAHPVEEFFPPRLSMIEGGGFIAQLATRVLGLWRPLRPEASEHKAEIKSGKMAAEEFLTENTIGIKTLKDRIRGRVGRLLQLGIRGGHVLPEPPSDNNAPITPGDAWEPN